MLTNSRCFAKVLRRFGEARPIAKLFDPLLADQQNVNRFEPACARSFPFCYFSTYCAESQGRRRDFRKGGGGGRGTL